MQPSVNPAILERQQPILVIGDVHGMTEPLALALAEARGPVWSHMNRLLALLVGGSLVAGAYIGVLWLLGGIPSELKRPPRTRRHGELPTNEA